MPSLQYGSHTIEYALTFAPRKTLAIHVYPDLSITVKAPTNTAPEVIHQRVQRRAAWILKQQRQFQLYLPNVPPRQYVSGESHRYLGRQYRLKIIAKSTPHLEAKRDATAFARCSALIYLTRQFMVVEIPHTTRAEVRAVVQAWYHQQAAKIFGERLSVCYAKLKRLGLPTPRLALRVMASSWGSCSAKGTISLNPKLIQVPLEYLDYVIIHELCHLKHLHHGPEFYKLLTRALPDWESKREKLNRFEFG